MGQDDIVLLAGGIVWGGQNMAAEVLNHQLSMLGQSLIAPLYGVFDGLAFPSHSRLYVKLLFASRYFEKISIQAKVSIKTAFIVQIVALAAEHAELKKMCQLLYFVSIQQLCKYLGSAMYLDLGTFSGYTVYAINFKVFSLGKDKIRSCFDYHQRCVSILQKYISNSTLSLMYIVKM